MSLPLLNDNFALNELSSHFVSDALWKEKVQNYINNVVDIEEFNESDRQEVERVDGDEMQDHEEKNFIEAVTGYDS